MALFCSIPFRQYAPVLDNILPSEYPRNCYLIGHEVLHVIGAPNSVKTADRTGGLIMNSRNVTYRAYVGRSSFLMQTPLLLMVYFMINPWYLTRFGAPEY
ncbi:Uncharacterized protein APZ42_033313 [Daphnia magna]|uniref:Uncharacterized protein n=1 Tax=Daphnia magna TaxID=35525 RepID=A0A164L8G6_9CRUS|nr:Uncharacterized protein APZ42_033313 [Daphnia magna]